MNILWTAPYSLVQDSEVKAKVEATNERGTSTVSPQSTVNTLVEVVPHTMTAPTKGPQTSNAQVEVMWLAQSSPENGSSPITIYNLQMHNGDGNFVDVIGGSAVEFLGSSYLISSGITQGVTYTFRIKSANKWGWANAFSPIV